MRPVKQKKIHIADGTSLWRGICLKDRGSKPLPQTAGCGFIFFLKSGPRGSENDRWGLAANNDGRIVRFIKVFPKENAKLRGGGPNHKTRSRSGAWGKIQAVMPWSSHPHNNRNFEGPFSKTYAPRQCRVSSTGFIRIRTVKNRAH